MKNADSKHFETHITYGQKSSSIVGAYKLQYKSTAFIVESDPDRPPNFLFFNLTLINLGTKKQEFYDIQSPIQGHNLVQ